LQSSCPSYAYVILEGREQLGGTWDLFRYPGIRSDSDMYTLGYAFRPWSNPQAIADGPSILTYIRETAEEYGVDRKIRYGQRVETARWSTADARWTVDARDPKDGAITTYRCRFLYLCSGYYDYDNGYTPDFPGRERFQGRIVHPQKWTPDIDYDGKRVVVIGSGATAVTLVPELAKRAAHVTMLQRSPSYIVSMPGRDAIAEWARAHLPATTAYSIARWKNVALMLGFYTYCRRFPEHAKGFLVRHTQRQLRGAANVDPHFTPSYNPWDQRLCVVPDADLFAALRSGRASVVTDHIETFTETGLHLRSGRELPADLVVTATGLRLKLFGGIRTEVDGRPIEPSRKLVYKGMMCSDVPNLAFAIGYTNASWTLKCDLTSAYVCRLLRYMDAHQYSRCCPRRNDPTIQEVPLVDFTSGYIQRSIAELPHQGSAAPWRLYQNYALDRMLLRHSRVDDSAMEFAR
jgi:cation diffusion facilitator CzcD-associated flavoprotein CzcO